MLLVALAAVAAFVAETLIAPSNLSLIFVIPVVVAAAVFGLKPALAASVAGVAVFDFFFLTPRYTLRVSRPSDLWALALLTIVALVVSGLGAQSRRRGEAASQAAEELKALREVSRVAAGRPPAPELAAAAAQALHRIFRAPVVILVRRDLNLTTLASAGGPQFGEAERAAARWALGSAIVVHAQTYPHDASNFDFWPVGAGLVVGVDFTAGAQPRPETASQTVALAAAPLVVATRGA